MHNAQQKRTWSKWLGGGLWCDFWSLVYTRLLYKAQQLVITLERAGCEAQRINLPACCACIGREDTQSIFPSPHRALVTGLGDPRRWIGILLQRARGSLYPNKWIRASRWLVPTRTEESLVSVAGPAAVSCSEELSLDGFTILLFLAAARERSAPSLLRKSYIFALKELWLTDFPLWGSLPVPRVSGCFLLGTAEATLWGKAEGRRQRKTHLHPACRLQAGLGLPHAACSFLLWSLPQALCTFTIL